LAARPKGLFLGVETTPKKRTAPGLTAPLGLSKIKPIRALEGLFLGGQKFREKRLFRGTVFFVVRNFWADFLKKNRLVRFFLQKPRPFPDDGNFLQVDNVNNLSEKET
jgi:hypothetical protein